MNSRTVTDYESLYGVGLLDDLHNYFPALLYDAGAFLTVPEVLAYVQQQTRRRFDLFTLGRNTYMRNQIPAYTGSPFIFSPRARATSPTAANPETLLSLFTRMLNTNFAANVIVRPSAEVISEHTTLTQLTTTTNEVCAICQDGYEVGNERRSLNACHHTFHSQCIDTWFQENVHCPVCRHDIREPALAEQT